MVARRTGRCSRKPGEQSGNSSMLVLQQKVQISNLFAAVNDVSFPDVESSGKSLKEKKLEELAERARRIEEHERRFEEDANIDDFNYVDDSAFLGRESEEADACVSATNVYEDDLKSLKEVYEPEISVETFITRLDFLHSSRPKVVLKAEEFRKFKEDGKRLTKFQKDCDVVRHPDYEQRIRKIEMFNSKHQRLSRQEVQKDEGDGLIEETYFDFDLLCSVNVYPIKKTQKDLDGVESFISSEALEEQRWKRRMGLLENVHEMVCQKSTNPKIALVEKQYEELNQKLADNKKALRADEKARSAFVKKLDSLPGTSGSRKRKLSDAIHSDDANDSWQTNMNRIFTKIADGSPSSEKEEVPRWKKELREEERRRKERKRRQNEERRKEAEEELKRKEKERKKEEENRRKEKEREDEIRAQREREEKEKIKRQLEEQRLREELEEKERQRALKAEQERLYQEQLREKERREAEQKEKEIREIEIKMTGLRNLVEGKKKNDDAVVNIDASAKPTLNGPWRLLKIKCPNDQKLKKNAYFERYGFASDDVVRRTDHEERMREICDRSAVSKKPIVIPQEDNRTTNSYTISIPKSAVNIVSASLAKQQILKNPTLPKINAADVFRQIREWVHIKKSAQFPLYPIQKQEVSYTNIPLGNLRELMTYPFHAADGMYWPIFFGLPKNCQYPVEAQAKAMMASNTFSGKHASRLLLTTHLSEENLGKKFDQNYADSDGDWAEYSQKEGRFSKRKGFRAERTKCRDSFDTQRKRAVQANREAFEREMQEMRQIETHYHEYRRSRDEDKYNNQYTVHLQKLVKDARLDMYTLREPRARNHPGTRDTHIDPRWHNHGYDAYFKTRDKAYVSVMNRECLAYESILPFREDRADFEQWALTPMLVSLYYQAVYNNFQVFDTAKTNLLVARKAEYDKLMKAPKFSLDRAIELCKLTDADKEQWTILNDQLVSHFKVFPAVYSHMYSRNDPLHECTQRAITVAMQTWCKDNANSWNFD